MPLANGELSNVQKTWIVPRCRKVCVDLAHCCYQHRRQNSRRIIHCKRKPQFHNDGHRFRIFGRNKSEALEAARKKQLCCNKYFLIDCNRVVLQVTCMYMCVCNLCVYNI